MAKNLIKNKIQLNLIKLTIIHFMLVKFDMNNFLLSVQLMSNRCKLNIDNPRPNRVKAIADGNSSLSNLVAFYKMI